MGTVIGILEAVDRKNCYGNKKWLNGKDRSWHITIWIPTSQISEYYLWIIFWVATELPTFIPQFLVLNNVYSEIVELRREYKSNGDIRLYAANVLMVHWLVG